MKPTREVKRYDLGIAKSPLTGQDIMRHLEYADGAWVKYVDIADLLQSPVHVDKPLAESAVAPGECVSVPDERAAFEAWARPAGFDNLILSGDDYFWPPAHYAWKAWKARASLGMQPPNNQPSLICKSCGVDRSKEDCKGDRLKCGLASVAQSGISSPTYRPNEKDVVGEGK